MIGTIYKKVEAYISDREGVALAIEIRMHPWLFAEILDTSEYQEVEAAFNMNAQKHTDRMFNYPFVIDRKLKRDECLVQSQIIK